jgi:hypothetical protein
MQQYNSTNSKKQGRQKWSEEIQIERNTETGKEGMKGGRQAVYIINTE